MKDSLRKYLKSRGAVPLDPRSIEAYEKAMKRVLPKIEQEARQNLIRVAKIKAQKKPLFGCT